jgi:hypothetical protein
MDNLDDAEVAVEEDDVQREAHKEHMHGGRRSDQHPASFSQLVAAEQPPHPSERLLSELAALADDGAILFRDARNWQTMCGHSALWSSVDRTAARNKDDQLVIAVGEPEL